MLLATLSDNIVVSKQTGKVRDKDRTWDNVKKSLLGNINGFLEELKVWSVMNQLATAEEAVLVRSVVARGFRLEKSLPLFEKQRVLCSFVLVFCDMRTIPRVLQSGREDECPQQRGGQLSAVKVCMKRRLASTTPNPAVTIFSDKMFACFK